MEQANNYQILLFYKYVHLPQPEEIMKWQKELCQKLNLKCRTIVAHEGINGTLEGVIEATEEYINEMNNFVMNDKDGNEVHPFQNIHWKKSSGTGDAFPRISVKVRNEIVSLHLDEEDFDPNETTGNHLKPEELQEWFDKGEEFYIVDMRNDYELEVGKFEGTIFPGLENFRDLKERVKEIENLKDKKVLTVCTGGIRCEKASGFLIRKGFKDVHQLDGGMVSYMKKFPGKNFKGSLYVFDGRTTMTYDSLEEHEVIGVCHGCKTKTERYGNCADPFCNKHMIVCEGCKSKDLYCNLKCRLGHLWSKIKGYKDNRKHRKDNQ